MIGSTYFIKEVVIKTLIEDLTVFSSILQTFFFDVERAKG